MDGADHVGYFSCLALDGLSRPHISYFDYARYALKYAYWNGSTWMIEAVDSEGNVGWYTSLALDDGGGPHISYVNYGMAQVKYACHVDGSWRIEGLAIAGGYEGTSIRVDESGAPHIGYAGDGGLVHAFRGQTGWILDVVDTQCYGYVSLAFDESTNPCMSFYDGTADDLMFARSDNGSWSVTAVDTLGDAGRFSSLAFDCLGAPRVSYLGGDDLKQAILGQAGWGISIVDQNGSVGKAASLVVDEGGSTHVAYVDDRRDALKYARWESGEWHIETVDSVRLVAHHASLALDGQGCPHISYYEFTPNHDLWYAWWDGMAWQHELVDAEGRVGTYCSLALDSLGIAHVGYYDGTNSRLKYAVRTATGWTIEAVDDDGSWAGMYASLALGSDQRPCLAYKAGSGLKYAMRAEEGWQCEVVDDSDNCGGHASLVLDGFDRPHISYETGVDTYDLAYASRDQFGWATELVDREGSYLYTSLDLDPMGNPHIAYYSWTHTLLKYAHRVGHEWHVKTVDSAGEVGADCSLALDAQGSAHICYFDATGLDLKYAFRPATQIVLTGVLAADALHLAWTWSPLASAYWVYGVAGHAYFAPGLVPD